MIDVAGTGLAESALQDDGLTVALSIMSDGATLSSEDGVIRFTNPAQDRLFGYAQGELIGKHVSVLNAYSAEENARIVGAALEALARSGAWSGEWLNKRKDGSVFITVSDIRAVMWRGKKHLLCARRPAESATRRSDEPSQEAELFSLAARASHLGIWEWELASNTFIYSDRARIMCGFPNSDIITYEDVTRVTHPADLPQTLAQAARALDPAIRDRTPYEYRIVRPTGEIRWVRAYGYAVFAEDGIDAKALRYVGTLEDITDRVEARAAEHEAARQVRLALELARMAVWSVDLGNRSLKSSPEFNQLFGFAADAQPSLEDVEARQAPDDVAAERARWGQTLEGRAQTYTSEFRIVVDGHERCLQVRCDIGYNPDGTPDRAVGIIMDVTEASQARNALSESDARFREAAHSAPAPVWMTNSEGKVEFGNRAMAEFAGLPIDDIMGDVWLARMHPDDLPAVIAIRAKAWADGHAPYTVEARFKRADGDWRWLEINSRARRDATDQFCGYVGLAVDRTDARELLASVRESEERFRLLADSAPVMIWMSEIDGSCLYLNAALRAFWNVRNEDVSSFDWRSTMHPEDEPRITADVVQATTAQKSFTTQGRYRDADGAYRIVQTRGVPRYAGSGEFLGMIGVNVDLTDLLAAQEHQAFLLEELNHRVKNTLAVVQSLAKQTFRSDAGLDVARGVFDERLRALAGAHTLLTRSNWENAQLRDVVEQAVQVCGDSSARVLCSGPEVLLSPKQALSIAMALHELCTNASKHGALCGGTGNIRLIWALENAELKLEWRERDGPAVVQPQRRGFGSTLLERVLPRDVNGSATLAFSPEGVVYQLVIPMVAR